MANIDVGYFSSNNLQYVYTGALVKVSPPTGKYFLPNGNLTSKADDTTVSYKWVKIVKVIGDGSNSGQGALSDGTGPIILSDNVPTGCKFDETIPEFTTI